MQVEVQPRDDAIVAAVDQEDKKTVEPPEKAYYSKLSVWLMVLFSGLAIGSDG